MYPLRVSILLVLTATAAFAAPAPEVKCEAAKNLAAGNYAFCRQKAEQKLAAKGDATKYAEALGKCAAKLSKAWAKAEEAATAKGAACPDEPLAEDALEAVIEQHSQDIASGLATGRLPACPGEPPACTSPAGMGQGPWQQKCQAAKNLAAGRYALCRQKAEKALLLKGDAEKYAEAVAACETKLAKAWQKTDEKAAKEETVCPDAPLAVDAFKRLVDLHSSDVSAALAAGSLREHCGDQCIESIAPPALIAETGDEFCLQPCAVEPSLTPACGTCSEACDLGQSCVNGTCRCLAGAPMCRPTRPVPLCPVYGRDGIVSLGCSFLDGVDLETVTHEYSIVEIDVAADTDAWIHVDGRSLFADGATIFPYVMSCQTGRGQLWYPNNRIQTDYFGENGVILDEGGLNAQTTTTRVCKTWEDGPVLPLFNSGDFPRGYMFKFRPGAGESGYAYQVFSMLFVDHPLGNTNLKIVDYVINVLPDDCAPITVTASAQAPVAVTPSGPLTLENGSTPSFEVTVSAPIGGIAVGGTCPRGTWSGTTYSITEPLAADCNVEFGPPS